MPTRIVTLQILIVLLLLSGCGSKQDAKSVKVGFVSSGISAVVVEEMKREHEGRCSEDCAAYQFVGFANPPALNNALVFGEIDVAIATSAASVALARAQDRDIKYVFPNVINSVSVVVNSSSGYSALSDLEGQRIGWYGLPTAGGLGFLLVSDTAADAVSTKFQISQSGAPLLPSLLERGDVDAIVVFEPIATRLVAGGEYRRVTEAFWQEWQDRRGYPLELSGTAASGEFIDENSESVDYINGLWSEAAGRIVTSSSEYVARHSELLGIGSEAQAEAMSAVLSEILVTEWGEIRKGIDDVNEYLIENGFVEREQIEDMFWNPEN